jgi:Zn-dependent protease
MAEREDTEHRRETAQHYGGPTEEELRRLYSFQEPERDYVPVQPEPAWRSLLRRLWAPIAVILGLAFKFGATTFKFFGIFISVAGYALLWGWSFAIGFVLLILAHELGHYFEARRQGLHPAAPVFIPFLGAYVAIKDAPRHDPWSQVLIALAGPVAGGIAALGVWGVGEANDSRFLIALAYTAFFLNLFNLLPVAILDGGFAWRAIRELRRSAGWTGRAGVAAVYYAGLAVVLALAMWATHVPQDRL